MNFDDQVDIFRDLDTDLLELFRRQQLEEFLASIPNHELPERIGILNQRYHSHNRYIKLIWMLDILPLPVIRYRRVWRDININQLFIRSIMFIATTITKIFRLTTFALAATFYLQGTIKRFFLFGNELTFSSNFIRDVVTFVVRNNLMVFSRLALISDNPTFTSNDASFLNTLGHSLIDLLFLQLDYKCETTEAGKKCFPKNTSLIFKFHDILQAGDLVSIMVYLLYALIGNLICLNVLYYFMISIFQNSRKWVDFNTTLLKVIFKSIIS